MSDLQDYIRLYQLPTGRRIFAQRQVAELAKRGGHKDLENHARAAVEHDEKTRRLEMDWAAQRGAQKSDGEAVRLDNEIDRTLGSLHSFLSALAVSPVDGVGREEAQKVLADAFPRGATTYTVLAFEEQASAVDVLVEKLRGALKDAATSLRLTPFVESLKKRNGELKAVLSKEKKPGLSFDEVRAAEERGQALLLETVARVLGMVPSSSEADVRARGELLGPIWRQNEDVRLSRRRRREAPDVDPATGEVVATEVAPVLDTVDG